jgi:hypothetical protein
MAKLLNVKACSTCSLPLDGERKERRNKRRKGGGKNRNNMMFMPSFIKIRQLVPKLLGGTHTDMMP